MKGPMSRRDLKRLLVILTPLGIILMIFAVLPHYFHPQIESFAIKQIREISQSLTPVEISVKNFDLHFFPPAAELHSIKLIPKTSQLAGLSDAKIESVMINLDLIQLLVGRLGVSSLVVENPKFKFDLDQINEESSSLPSFIGKKKVDLAPLFDQLKIFPVRRVYFHNLVAEVFSNKKDFEFSLEKGDMTLISASDRFEFDSDFSFANVSYGAIKNRVQLQLGFALQRDKVDVSKFRLSGLGGNYQFDGLLLNLNDLSKGNIRGRVDAVIDDLGVLSKAIRQKWSSFPLMRGSLRLSSKGRVNGGGVQLNSIELLSKSLAVDNIEIGEIEFAGEWKGNHLAAKKFQIESESSSIQLPQFSVTADGSQVFLKTQLQTNFVDLSVLLQNLGVGNIPIDLITSGDFICEGPLYPSFSLNCRGGLQADFFEARSEYENGNPIVQLDEVKASGSVGIDASHVWYKSDVKIGQSSGTSEGTISYKDGFDIGYDTSGFHLEDIDYLVGLKLEGIMSLEGRIAGNSNHATFYIKTGGENVWFEDFFLGNPKMFFKYHEGILDFTDIKSNINASRFTGDLSVDLNKEQISIIGRGKIADVNDALQAFQRKVVLPVGITGKASVEINAKGPLEFSRLSYDFSSHIEQGSIAGETFESGVFSTHSESGEVTLRDLTIKKSKGTITGQGVAHPDGTVYLTLESHGTALEDSENIAKNFSSISGAIDAKLTLEGKILNPTMSVQVALKNINVDDVDIAPCQGRLKWNSGGFEGMMNLFSGKLTSSFVVPKSESDPFKLEVSARDWDYASVFSVLGGGHLLSEYSSSLTGDLKLQADRGGILNSSGEGVILKAELKRKDLQLVNQGKMTMKVENGAVSFDNFKMAGGDSFVEIGSTNSKYNKLNLKINTNVQLHLLQVFVPNMEGLSGKGQLQAIVGGSLERPEVLGSGRLENGLIKVKNFSHAFEKIYAEGQFSQAKLIVSKISGIFAGGSLNGDGTISLIGMKNISVMFKAQFQNVSLNIPEKMRTTGYGEITLSGSWFPFTLGGVYHVTGGLISKEFSNSEFQEPSKRSAYLPRGILQSANEPIELHFQIFIDQPVMIKNSIVNGDVSGYFGISGVPAAPILEGRLNFDRGSKINFRDKSFDVVDGVVIFNNPKEINPELFISGRSHVSDYDINLIVQGTAKNPLIRLESYPSLSYPDIVSLLALGITTSGYDSGGVLQRKDYQGVTAQALVAGFSEITKDVQKAFNVDISASSQYDEVARTAVQRYTISYKINDSILLNGTKTAGDLDSGSVQLKYRLNPTDSLSATYESVSPGLTGVSTQIQPAGTTFGFDFEYKREFR